MLLWCRLFLCSQITLHFLRYSCQSTLLKLYALFVGKESHKWYSHMPFIVFPLTLMIVQYDWTCICGWTIETELPWGNKQSYLLHLYLYHIFSVWKLAPDLYGIFKANIDIREQENYKKTLFQTSVHWRANTLLIGYQITDSPLLDKLGNYITFNH